MFTGTWNAVRRHKWAFLTGGSAAAGLVYLGRQVYVQYKQLSAMLEDTDDLDRLLASLLGLNPEELPPPHGSRHRTPEREDNREDGEIRQPGEKGEQEVEKRAEGAEGASRDAETPAVSFSAWAASLTSPLSSFFEKLGVSFSRRENRATPRASASAEWQVVLHFLRTQRLADRSVWELREEIRGVVDVAFDISHYTALLRDPASSRTLSPVAKRRCFFHMGVEIYARTLMAIYLLVLLVVLHRVQVNIVARQTFYGVYTPGFALSREGRGSGDSGGARAASASCRQRRRPSGSCDARNAGVGDSAAASGASPRRREENEGEGERGADEAGEGDERDDRDEAEKLDQEDEEDGRDTITLEELNAANYLFLTTTRSLLSSQTALDLIAVEIHRASRQVLRDVQPEGVLSSKDLLHLLLLILVTAHTRILRRAETGDLPQKRRRPSRHRSLDSESDEEDEEEEEEEEEGEEEEDRDGAEEKRERERGRSSVLRCRGLAALLLPESQDLFDASLEEARVSQVSVAGERRQGACSPTQRIQSSPSPSPQAGSDEAPCVSDLRRSPIVSALVEAQLAEARDLLEAPACAEATADAVTAALWLAVQCLQGCLLQAGLAVAASPSSALDAGVSRNSFSLSSSVSSSLEKVSRLSQLSQDAAASPVCVEVREEKARVEVTTSSKREQNSLYPDLLNLSGREGTRGDSRLRLPATSDSCWAPTVCRFAFARTFGRICQLADFVLGSPQTTRVDDEAWKRVSEERTRPRLDGEEKTPDGRFAASAKAWRGETKAVRKEGQSVSETERVEETEKVEETERVEETESDVLAFVARLPAIEEFSSFAFFPTATEDELDAVRALLAAAREKETVETRRFLLPVGRLSERRGPAFRHMAQMQREVQKQLLLASLREEQDLRTRRKQREDARKRERRRRAEAKGRKETCEVCETPETPEPHTDGESLHAGSEKKRKEGEALSCRLPGRDAVHSSPEKKEGVEKEEEGTGRLSFGEDRISAAVSDSPLKAPPACRRLNKATGKVQEGSERRQGCFAPVERHAASRVSPEVGRVPRGIEREATGGCGEKAKEGEKGKEASSRSLLSSEVQVLDDASAGALDGKRDDLCAPETPGLPPSFLVRERTEPAAGLSPSATDGEKNGEKGDALTPDEEGFLDCQRVESELSLDVHLIESRLSSRGPLDSWTGAEVSLASSFADRRPHKREAERSGKEDRKDGDEKAKGDQGSPDERGAKNLGACGEVGGAVYACEKRKEEDSRVRESAGNEERKNASPECGSLTEGDKRRDDERRDDERKGGEDKKGEQGGPGREKIETERLQNRAEREGEAARGGATGESG
ncbi:peroxin-3 [Toxoplasma gondii RUB]|uniref:Peroxin-3 n=1 Tax=Toxoplasma gondii RUB TaxID=935652 RepID=A0A086LM94_TOXGO|nr:peroxin-3 [Toxoplasma gondii RUB]